MLQSQEQQYIVCAPFCQGGGWSAYVDDGDTDAATTARNPRWRHAHHQFHRLRNGQPMITFHVMFTQVQSLAKLDWKTEKILIFTLQCNRKIIDTKAFTGNCTSAISVEIVWMYVPPSASPLARKWSFDENLNLETGFCCFVVSNVHSRKLVPHWTCSDHNPALYVTNAQSHARDTWEDSLSFRLTS